MLQFLEFPILVCILFLANITSAGAKDAVTDIGSRRELFVDAALIESLTGQARLELHHPEAREVVLDHNAAWEGTGSGYHSVFKDGNKYKMYYKSWHLDVSNGKVKTNTHPLYCCYAESDDGIHWTKPNLGLIEFNGSTDNNIVLTPTTFNDVTSDPGHPAVFIDENPNCPPDARYKAIIRSSKPHGLLLFQSADGFRWLLSHPTPVITAGAFDSQNLAFYDPNINAYRAYWRIFTAGKTDGQNWTPAGHRAIRTAVSQDLIHWDQWMDLTYVDSPSEQLYTNGIKPYHRAPHLLIGFPTRYVERGWSESMKALPELPEREARAKASERYGTAITEGLFMSSRDGLKFHRWNEAFLPPGIERTGTWNYGQQYLAWHVVQTKSLLEGAPDELSFYATESYWTGNSSQLRRYALRLDGFVSVTASMKGGELVSRPVRFNGNRLSLNFATSAAGDVRVELQDASGKPFSGFSAEECQPLFGDTIDRAVTWTSGPDVSSLQDKTVRIRFILRDADLYSYQFVSTQ